MNQASYQELAAKLKNEDTPEDSYTVEKDEVEEKIKKVSLEDYGLDIVEVTGSFRRIFVEKIGLYVPQGTVIAMRALQQVQEALSGYQRLPELDHNLIALYEETRPVFIDQEKMLWMMESLSSEKQMDVFYYAFGMLNGSGCSRLESIDNLMNAENFRDALETLTILKQFLDRSKQSAEYYRVFGRELVESAVRIYLDFRYHFQEYQDISQWEYETLIWSATEAQFHPDGIGGICSKEFGRYDPNDDPELPALKKIDGESKEPASDA